MDDELTAISSSYGMQVGDVGSATETPDTCRNIFDKAFPSYLSMGMTYDEFYNKDHTLTIAYRKAFEMKRERVNEELWLQGAYVYEAIARLTPLFNPFAKHPKPEPYLDKPYPIFEKKLPDENAKSKAVIDRGVAYMQSMMLSINKKFGEV